MLVWSIFGGSWPSRSVNCLLSMSPPTTPTPTSNTFHSQIEHLGVECLCFVKYIKHGASQTLKQHCTFRRKQGSRRCAELGVMLAILFVLWKLWGTFRARQTCPPLVAAAAVRACQQKEKCTTTCQDTRTPTITMTISETWVIVYHSYFSWFSKFSKFK